MTKMTDITRDDRPREKLAKYGAEKLSDLELIMAIIGSGNKQVDVTKISRDVLKLLRSKREISLEEVRGIVGVGEAKATELAASFELARRYLLESDRPIIDSPEKAVEQLADIRDKKQEYFVCLTLDGANRLIAKRTITIGTLTSSLVHPREVFADAITDRAASIIVAHNHPSGNPQPSDADKQITERLESAATLLGIKLNDHIVLTKR
ncbi:MAG: DNA repair protein RadC [Candidatus Saccharimonadales bacterium]